MDTLYSQVTNYLVASGRQILELAGNVKDIGILKDNLTVEDLRIERGLSALITNAFPEHKIYAEEEHTNFQNGDDVWVIDPISGTRAFIAGLPHYALVASHLHKGVVQFACVYDPSVNELFTARRGQGALLNGMPIHVSSGLKRIVLNTATSVYDSVEAVKWRTTTQRYKPYRNTNSFAVNYCWVAAGRFDGVVAVTKDSFAEFAGALIIAESGGKLTNTSGDEIVAADTSFVGGNVVMYSELLNARNGTQHNN